MGRPAPSQPETSFQADTEVSLLGRTLGEFVLREKLGQGGGGLVFRAEQTLLAREAVIKVLGASLQPQQDTVQRFMREARLASKLDHPYAAHIYAFGVEPDGVLWIAMEFVHGTPLDKLLKAQGRLPLARFVPLFDRICEVVQTAHDQGIIHRDLKPANVMVLSRAGRLLPKLLDFGIAKRREDAKEGTGGNRPSSPSDALISPGQMSISSPRAVSEQLVRAASVSSTSREPFIGTPHYMAPEQWINAEAVDPRIDLYALAVLAFEALTGHRPFEGKTLLDLAREHATKSVPSLGPDLPESLCPVLTRALAKRGKDRFATVLEFAAAFRSAAGLGEELDQLPQVDDAVKERTLTEAPQPIAETLTALEASRSLGSAIEATMQMFRVVAQYMGLLALASRSRIAAGGAADNPSVLDGLRKLRRQSLENREWIRLARELCRPFAPYREAYPIPELVSFFFDPTSGQETRWSELFESPSTDQAESAPPSEKQKRELLAREVARLTRLLRAIAFVFDYPLLVSRGEQGESWAGIRRSHRTLHPLRGASLPENQPSLTDREGQPILPLWPLMQALAPTPGAPAELFMLEGNGRHGAKLVASPLGFERHDEALWSWFAERIIDLSQDATASSRGEAAPYMGLAAFTSGDAKNFFGREREAEAFANRLRVQSLLAVVGPSGSGKSSFVQAGVIPLLSSEWRSLTVRPGPSPFCALATRLAHEGVPVEPGSKGWQNPEALGNCLRAWAQQRGAPILLVVDQFEELLTLCQDQKERVLFSEALVSAAHPSVERVRVILTLRDDFLIRAQQLPPFREALGVGLQLLGTPAPADLIRILTCPARQAGYEFDDDQLPVRMVNEVADQPGALALLSFTASKLWELRDRHFHRLTRRAYESLGGVGGALARHAEATLGAMTSEEQPLVREAFRHLITAERTRAVLTRGELSQVLGGGRAAEVALEHLIQGRLLTAAEGQGGENRIEVIHEALLSSWPRLVRWQQEDAESARMRHQLRAAARQWEERGRGKGLVWRKEALMEYRVWRSRYSGRLTDAEEAFAAASLGEEARGRRARRILFSAAFLALAIGLVVVTRANRIAAARLLAIYEEQGRQLLLSGDPLRGIVYLDRAYSQGASSPALRFLLGRATRALDAQVASLPHSGPVVDAHFSPDGARVVTASRDMTAKLWSNPEGKLIATLAGHRGGVHSARFSPDGRRIVTSSSDGTAKVWDALGGELLASLDAGASHPAPTLAEFSPNSEFIVTAIGKIARVWDARNFSRLAVLEGHLNRIKAFKIDAKSQDIFTYGQEGVLKRWTKSGRLLFSVTAHAQDYYPQYLRPLDLSRDGKSVLTATGDNTAKVWNAETGAETLRVAAAEGFIFSTSISPSGREFVTSSDESIVKIWNIATGKAIRFLQGHSASVWFASYNRDGSEVLTASSDATARLWSHSSGGPTMTLVGHVDTVVTAELSPDENRVVTASLDGTAKIWDRRENPLLFDIKDTSIGELDLMIYAGISRDGNRVLTVSDIGSVKVWELAGSRLLHHFEASTGSYGTAAWSPDESLLAVGDQRNVTVFELMTGRVRLVLETHAPVSALQFSPDNAWLAGGSSDPCARIWDARTGAKRLSFNSRCGNFVVLAFSQDGKRLLAAGEDKKVELWDVESGARLLVIDDFKALVRAASFSPDGRKLITATGDKRLVLWDAQSGQPLVLFPEAKAANVNTVEFNPDGTLVLTADVSGSAAIWDVASGRLLTRYSRGAAPVGMARFSGNATRAMSVSVRDVMVWDTRSDTRTQGQISTYVRCRVPFRIEEENLLQREIDPRACQP